MTIALQIRIPSWRQSSLFDHHLSPLGVKVKLQCSVVCLDPTLALRLLWKIVRPSVSLIMEDRCDCRDLRTDRFDAVDARGRRQETKMTYVVVYSCMNDEQIR